MRYLLYIDPGTGSMLFTLAVGLLSALWFGARALFMKLKYLAPGIKQSDRQKKDIVIYGEDKRYWTTFKGILDELERRKVPATYLAGSADDPLLGEQYKYIERKVIGLGNKAFAKLNFLNARILLATTPSLGVYQWKRSVNVDWYVHLTHYIGSGLDYRMFGTAFFDALLYSSDCFTADHRLLEESLGLKAKEIVAVGCPYLDYLLARRPPGANNKPGEAIRVLVAPTWGQDNLFGQFGLDILDDLVSSGFDITLRPHPQSFISDSEMIEALKQKYRESGRLHWDCTQDNFEALKEADILLSDYSGIIYDFAFIFERPVIYAPLRENLCSRSDYYWLKKPVWFQEVLPQIGYELNDGNKASLAATIKEMVCTGHKKETIREVKERYWQNQGHSAKSVVDYLLSKL